MKNLVSIGKFISNLGMLAAILLFTLSVPAKSIFDDDGASPPAKNTPSVPPQNPKVDQESKKDGIPVEISDAIVHHNLIEGMSLKQAKQSARLPFECVFRKGNMTAYRWLIKGQTGTHIETEKWIRNRTYQHEVGDYGIVGYVDATFVDDVLVAYEKFKGASQEYELPVLPEKFAIKRADEKLARYYQSIVQDKLSLKEPLSVADIPLVGDETSLVLVKANPQKYVDVPFLVSGLFSLTDYYNFGYMDSKPTHYSYNFFTKGERATVYAKKAMGDDLILILAHMGQISPNTEIPIRFKVTISSRYVKTYDDAIMMLEVLDWQIYDDNKKQWGPWHSDSVDTEVPVSNTTDGGDRGDYTTHIGRRGGQYHYSKNGNKVYNKK